MIAVFYGKDSFSAHEALDALRDKLPSDGLADNTERVDGANARPGELLARCRTVPFLATHRMIIVDGLLSRFEPPRPRRGQPVRRRRAPDLGPWQSFLEGIRDLPESTVLVFLDGDVTDANPMLKAVRPVAKQVKSFAPMRQADVATWINGRAGYHGVTLQPRAVATLASLVGSNLWLLDSELQKVAAYAAGQPVTEADVQSLVSLARETTVFALCDAIVEGRVREAADQLQRLLAEESPQGLLAMVARQYRLLILVKEHLSLGAKPQEVASRLQLHSWVAQRLVKVAPAYSFERLRQAYRRIIEADLSIKRGVYDEETGLDLLVVELASMAPGASSPEGDRRGYSRRPGAPAPVR